MLIKKIFILVLIWCCFSCENEKRNNLVGYWKQIDGIDIFGVGYNNSSRSIYYFSDSTFRRYAGFLVKETNRYDFLAWNVLTFNSLYQISFDTVFLQNPLDTSFITLQYQFYGNDTLKFQNKNNVFVFQRFQPQSDKTVERIQYYCNQSENIIDYFIDIDFIKKSFRAIGLSAFDTVAVKERFYSETEFEKLTEYISFALPAFDTTKNDTVFNNSLSYLSITTKNGSKEITKRYFNFSDEVKSFLIYMCFLEQNTPPASGEKFNNTFSGAYWKPQYKIANNDTLYLTGIVKTAYLLEIMQSTETENCCSAHPFYIKLSYNIPEYAAKQTNSIEDYLYVFKNAPEYSIKSNSECFLFCKNDTIIKHFHYQQNLNTNHLFQKIFVPI